jgi:hypothetical protein
MKMVPMIESGRFHGTISRCDFATIVYLEQKKMQEMGAIAGIGISLWKLHCNFQTQKSGATVRNGSDSNASDIDRNQIFVLLGASEGEQTVASIVPDFTIIGRRSAESSGQFGFQPLGDFISQGALKVSQKVIQRDDFENWNDTSRIGFIETITKVRI